MPGSLHRRPIRPCCGKRRRRSAPSNAPATLSNAADPDTPIKRHPLFQEELKQAALYKLTDSVRLADAKAERLVATAHSPALVNNDILASLVADKTLTITEANSLRVSC